MRYYTLLPMRLTHIGPRPPINYLTNTEPSLLGFSHRKQRPYFFLLTKYLIVLRLQVNRGVS